MLKDFLDVFKKELDKHGDKIILDNYVLADGTYVIVKPSDLGFKIQSISEVKYNKKEKQLESTDMEVLDKLKEMDYNSCLVSMNKPIDIKKKIHSNNYLSFFLKKQVFLEKALNNEIIDGYYNILENPHIKYAKDKRSKALYENVEKQVGEVDTERLNKIREWIKKNIFELDVDKTRKDYLKIFFDFGIGEFEKEGKRYLIPNIYNKNDYNVEQNGEIYGLPNDNISLNSKKPYLENKTRGKKSGKDNYMVVPYLISDSEAILQKKAFDYLMNFATKRKYNIFFDENTIIAQENGELLKGEFSGQFMRVEKGKTLDIASHDVISGYNFKLKNPFKMVNVLGCSENLLKNVEYGLKADKMKIQSLLDDVLFSKFLINNYFSDIKELKVKDNNLKINLEIARKSVFNWLYKNDTSTIYTVLDKVSKRCIRSSINNDYIPKACNQFNLRYSILNYFKESDNMADILVDIKKSLREKINSKTTESFTSDLEYYFSIGQFVNYLASKSKSAVKTQAFVNPFIDAKNNKIIKNKLGRLYRKYNYDIKNSEKRVRNMYAMISSYETDSKVNQDVIIAGYLHNNLIFEKEGEKVNG